MNKSAILKYVGPKRTAGQAQRRLLNTKKRERKKKTNKLRNIEKIRKTRVRLISTKESAGT